MPRSSSTISFSATKLTAFFTTEDQLGMPPAMHARLCDEGVTEPDDLNELDKDGITYIAGVAFMSEIIEEEVWVNYGEKNTVATLKGVEPHYGQMSNIDSMMYRGEFILDDDGFPFCIPGLGVRSELSIPYKNDEYSVINVNAPIRGKQIKKYKEQAFNNAIIPVRGIYSVNAELDVKYIIAPVDFCKDLFGFENEISALEIDVQDDFDVEEVRDEIAALVGDQFLVRTKFEKNSLVYQTNQSEKWATFLILLFILMIAAFNIVAALTMLIIEKKDDIFILRSMGATKSMIHKIFVNEGVVIYMMGVVAGLVVGCGLCLAQQYFGLVRLQGAMVEFYPIEIAWQDLLGIIASVMVVGMLFSMSLVRYLIRRFASA